MVQPIIICREGCKLFGIIFRCTTLNYLRVNMKHFLGPILGAEVAQKRAPFPAVVTITEMGNANICILCDAVKKVERRVGAHTEFFSKTVEWHSQK